MFKSMLLIHFERGKKHLYATKPADAVTGKLASLHPFSLFWKIFCFLSLLGSIRVAGAAGLRSGL
jgi:hypothetical protein